MSQFFIYCRKSSEAEDRQVLSIESQVKELEQLASGRSLAIGGVFTEARSAKEPGRPVFDAMMQRLYRGEAQGIICWKLDRLARNPIDGGSIIWSIKQHGIKVITPPQTFCQADDNVILMYIEFGFAQKYIDDLSKNVKRGIRAKVERGCYHALAPMGYLNDRNRITGEKSIVKDPERFPAIRKMWDLMLSGLYTPPQILRKANEEWNFRTRQTRATGGHPMSRSTIYKIFAERFYCGWFEYPKGSGQWHRGNHELMVTEAEFEAVQPLLHRTGTPRAKARQDFAFTGLIRCGECHAAVTAEEKHQLICDVCRWKFAHRRRDRCPRCKTVIKQMSKPTFLKYTYYHCTKSRRIPCSQGSIRSDILEKQIEAFLSSIHLPKAFVSWASARLDELHAENMAARQTVSESQQRAYAACCARLGSLLDLKTSPDNVRGALLSDQEYAIRRTELVREKERLEQEMKRTGPRLENGLCQAKEAINVACLARERFMAGDPKTKREILARIQSNLTLKDKKVSIQAKKPFQIIEEASESLHDSASDIEPENNQAAPTPNHGGGARRPSLCGSSDDVRTLRPQIETMASEIYGYYCTEA